MGTRAAPNFANVYMGNFEKKLIHETEWKIFLIDWIRFIDDIFVIWKWTKQLFINFLNHLNTSVPLIQFTHEISKTEVNFLDTETLKKRITEHYTF